MAARAIFGMFGSGSMPASRAYVADRTTRAERAGSIAQIGAAFGLGTVVGPGVAAAFAEIHILAPFFAVGLLAFVSGFAIWILLPERTRPKTLLAEKQEKRASLQWRAPSVLPWLVIGVVLSLSQSIMMQLFAFYLMAELGMKGSEATQLVSVGMMAMAMATLVAQLGLIQRFDLSVQFLLRWGAVTMILKQYADAGSSASSARCVVGTGAAGPGFGFLRSPEANYLPGPDVLGSGRGRGSHRFDGRDGPHPQPRHRHPALLLHAFRALHARHRAHARDPRLRDLPSGAEEPAQHGCEHRRRRTKKRSVSTSPFVRSGSS